MPESPEVHALTEALRSRLLDARIVRIDLAEFRVWKSRDRRPETLAGAVITDVTRAGKHTLVATDRGVLVISYGRAGWARWPGDGSDDGDGGDTDGQRDEPPVVATLETDRDGPIRLRRTGCRSPSRWSKTRRPSPRWGRIRRDPTTRALTSTAWWWDGANS